MSGDYGNDSVDGGAGYDRLWVGWESGAEVDFRTATAVGGGTGGSGSVRFANIEEALGGDFGDRLTADDAGRTLMGRDGNDTLTGGAGDDELWGDGGFELWAADGDDLIFAGAGDDTLFGNDGNDTLYGGPGRDLINLAFANPLSDEEIGADSVLAENTRSSAAITTASGSIDGSTVRSLEPRSNTTISSTNGAIRASVLAIVCSLSLVSVQTETDGSRCLAGAEARGALLRVLGGGRALFRALAGASRGVPGAHRRLGRRRAPGRRRQLQRDGEAVAVAGFLKHGEGYLVRTTDVDRSSRWPEFPTAVYYGTGTHAFVPPPPWQIDAETVFFLRRRQGHAGFARLFLIAEQDHDGAAEKRYFALDPSFFQLVVQF